MRAVVLAQWHEAHTELLSLSGTKPKLNELLSLHVFLIKQQRRQRVGSKPKCSSTPLHRDAAAHGDRPSAILPQQRQSSLHPLLCARASRLA